MPLKFLHVSDARVPILSSPWSGSEYLPLDFVLVEYKGSPGYMQLFLWVNIVECDKNFREKLILPQFKEKAKKKKVYRGNQFEYKARGLPYDSSSANTTSLKMGRGVGPAKAAHLCMNNETNKLQTLKLLQLQESVV